MSSSIFEAGVLSGMDKEALSPKLLARALSKSKGELGAVAKKMESVPLARSKWKPEHFKLEKDMERLKRRESSFHTSRSTRGRAASSAKTTGTTPKVDRAPVGEKTNVEAMKPRVDAMDQGGVAARRQERQMARQAGQFAVSNQCSKMLGDVRAMFSERLIIQAQSHVDVDVKPKSPKEIHAIREAAAVYNRIMASGEVTRDIIEARNELRPPERRV